MKVRIVRLIAIGLLAGALGGCQTGSIDTTMTSAFQANAQGSLADRKIDSGKKQFAAGNYGLAERNFRAAVEASASALSLATAESMSPFVASRTVRIV